MEGLNRILSIYRLAGWKNVPDELTPDTVNTSMRVTSFNQAHTLLSLILNRSDAQELVNALLSLGASVSTRDLFSTGNTKVLTLLLEAYNGPFACVDFPGRVYHLDVFQLMADYGIRTTLLSHQWPTLYPYQMRYHKYYIRVQQRVANFVRAACALLIACNRELLPWYREMLKAMKRMRGKEGCGPRSIKWEI